MKTANPALIIAGPALIVFKGKALFSKENIAVKIQEVTFPINSSAYGKVAEGELSKLLEASFVPCGQLDAIAELYPEHLRSFIPGRLVHHARTLGAVDAGDDEITITNHGFRNQAMVRVDSYGTLDTGLNVDTLYFLHAEDADTISLHTTASDAADGTAPVNLAGDGVGTARIIEQEELLIWSLNEENGYVFHNAAVTKMPGIKGSTSETALKDVTFTMYRKFGIDPEDAAAFYTATTSAPEGIVFDPDDIKTGYYELGWGTDNLPWSALKTRDGVDADFPMTLDPVPDQLGGIVSHRVTDLRATATVAPTNVNETHIFAARTMQGAGAGTGRRLSGADFTIAGDDLHIIIYNAVLNGESQLNWDGTADRVSPLTFENTRKFIVGVPQPLFYIGAAAPAS